MRIFVAGRNETSARLVVSQLIERGHEVVGPFGWSRNPHIEWTHDDALCGSVRATSPDVVVQAVPVHARDVAIDTGRSTPAIARDFFERALTDFGLLEAFQRWPVREKSACLAWIEASVDGGEEEERVSRLLDALANGRLLRDFAAQWA